jgi:hypothetical protein
MPPDFATARAIMFRVTLFRGMEAHGPDVN